MEHCAGIKNYVKEFNFMGKYSENLSENRMENKKNWKTA